MDELLDEVEALQMDVRLTVWDRGSSKDDLREMLYNVLQGLDVIKGIILHSKDINI